MSGICGIFSPRDPSLATPEALQRMLKELPDRGGDGEHTFVSSGDGIALGLTMRRSFEADGSSWWQDAGGTTTMDGEAYGWQPAGGDLPASTIGYYSAAAWNAQSRTLRVALDSLGSQTLYYWHDAPTGVFAFASRLDALLALPQVPRRLDPISLQVFLSRGSVFAPYTIYDGVRKLLPGEEISIDAGSELHSRVGFVQKRGTELDEPPEHLARALRSELAEAVARTAKGSSRLGIFASSGIDSAVLMAALQDSGATGIAYTLVYRKGLADDESEGAARVAAAVGIPHRVLFLDETPAPWYSTIARGWDEPIDFRRSPTNYILAKAMREDGLNSALNGISGENIYGGMEWSGFGAAREASGSDDEAVDRLLAQATLVSAEEQAKWLAFSPDEEAVTARILDSYRPLIDIADPYERYNANLLLRIPTGRHGVPPATATPLQGVDLRQPVRDQKLAGFGRRLPFALKEGGSYLADRSLVKTAYAKEFPFLLDHRRKHGSPGLPWRAPGYNAIDKALEGSFARLKKSDIFRPEVVDRLLARHRSESAGRSSITRILTLASLSIWLDVKVNGVDPFE